MLGTNRVVGAGWPASVSQPTNLSAFMTAWVETGQATRWTCKYEPQAIARRLILSVKKCMGLVTHNRLALIQLDTPPRFGGAAQAWPPRRGFVRKRSATGLE